MSERLRVDLELNNVDEINADTLKDSIINAVINKQSEFNPLFERIIDCGDARVTVMDESLAVGDCWLDSNLTSGSVSGMFGSNFYAGCNDMNSDSEHEIDLPFEIEDSTLIFDIELPLQWVPADDCY